MTVLKKSASNVVGAQNQKREIISYNPINQRLFLPIRDLQAHDKKQVAELLFDLSVCRTVSKYLWVLKGCVTEAFGEVSHGAETEEI